MSVFSKNAEKNIIDFGLKIQYNKKWSCKHARGA